jgi:hypothetical protein
MTSARPREDIFVSIGLIGTNRDPDVGEAIASLVKRLDAQFRYWELLFVTAEGEAPLEQLLRGSNNIRLIKVRRETPAYRKRLCLAQEAIGDVLVISALDELPLVDPLSLLAQCEESEAMITVRRAGSGWANSPLIAIGRSAGFHVDSRDMVSAAFPKAIINRLLKHPDAPLAMRFPPTDGNIPIQVRSGVCGLGPRRGGIRLLAYRLGLLQRIVVSSAPQVLGMLELLSLTVSLFAIVFCIYAVVVWLTAAFVQPGWFTTSLTLSLTATFLGLAIFGISIGIQRLLDLASRWVDDDVVDEVNSIDLFGSAMTKLNIEMDDSQLVPTGRPSAT